MAERYGPNDTPDEFPGIKVEDIPYSDLYKDYHADGMPVGSYKEETPNPQTCLDREIKTHEDNDNYVNSSVMFSMGNSFSRGEGIGQKRDADGNTTRQANTKPILDIHEYRVDFNNG